MRARVVLAVAGVFLVQTDPSDAQWRALDGPTSRFGEIRRRADDRLVLKSTLPADDVAETATSRLGPPVGDLPNPAPAIASTPAPNGTPREAIEVARQGPEAESPRPVMEPSLDGPPRLATRPASPSHSTFSIEPSLDHAPPEPAPTQGGAPDRETNLAPLPEAAGPAPSTLRSPPPIRRGQLVRFTGGQVPGTIVVRTRERALYLVQAEGRAIRYRIAVGKPGFAWTGMEMVSAKSIWPTWRPPTAMRRRKPYLPLFMRGGGGNPLGARAIYLGDTEYRIHGTTDPGSIGRAASSGCFRMLNKDVIELYEHVAVGTRVEVI